LKKSILFIINPNSGHKRGSAIIELIPQYLNLTKFDYKCEMTTHAKHALDITKQAVIEKVDIVIAVGGDGLVNEVFQCLVHTDTSFSIIPMGSGNGIARSMGIDMNIKKALQNLNSAKIAKIDTALFNGQQYLGVAGIGFDGFIAWEFSKTSKRGFWSYIKLVFRQIATYKSTKFIVSSDNNQWEFDAFIVTIANGQQYGNDAFIAPHAELDNGQLDLVVIKKHYKWMSPLLAIQVMTKNTHKSRHVEIIRAPKFIIKSSNKYAHIDGEPISPKNENVVKIIPSSLIIYK